MHLGYNLHVPGVEPGHSMISRQGCIHGDDDEIRFWQLARQIRADIRLSSLDGGGELWGIYRAIELFSSRALFKSATPLSLPEIQQIYIPSYFFRAILVHHGQTLRSRFQARW